MDLRHLEILIAVAEQGSFTAAARALHTAQSNVSTKVRQLEDELGAELVDRRSHQPTDAGEVAVARARRVLAEVAALSSDVAALRDEVVGQVRLGIIGSVGRWLVPSLLTEVAARHPQLELVVVDATTTSLAPLLIDGQLDLAVINLPVSDAQLRARALFDEERVLVVPDDHPLASQSEIGLADLAPYRLIMEPVGTAFRDELDTAALTHSVTLRSMAEVDGMTLVASLAFRGLGPAVLPSTALVRQPPDGWVRIRIRDLRHRSVGLAHRRGSPPAAPAEAVAEVLEEALRELAPRLGAMGVRVH